MKRLGRYVAIAVAITALACGLTAAVLYKQWRPEVNGFSPGPGQWRAIGGAWQLRKGEMRNNSDERGAKLITGSEHWRDYTVDADVALLGPYGDAGLLLRARDIGQGVDSYRGYFVGLRNEDNTLLMGSADYGWEEYRNVPLKELQTGKPYHLHVVVFGCSLAASVSEGQRVLVRTGVAVENCVPSGQAGLQSYQSPAVWTNFSVRPSTEADLIQTIGNERLGTKTRGDLHLLKPELLRRPSLNRSVTGQALTESVVPIADLKLPLAKVENEVNVRGVVRLLTPGIYLEDASGGILLKPQDDQALAIGDKVQAVGRVKMQDNRPVLVARSIQQILSETVMPPRPSAAYEAATGRLDDRLVALEGKLLRTWSPEAGVLVLELSSGGETFRALTSTEGYGSPLPDLVPRSELQLVGVVSSDQTYAGDSAFALLVSGNQDSVRVLQPAPWWTPQHIALLTLVTLALSSAAVLLLLRLRERALLFIVNEREMLAHDLHDTVAQSFAGIGYQLRALDDSLAPDNPRYTLVRAQAMVRQSHEELRRSITTLRSNLHDMRDLTEGLRRSAQRMIEGGGLRVECSFEGDDDYVPIRIADCFFRVGQEAIANAVAHAEASFVEARVCSDRKRLAMTVKDDGCGFASGQKSGGFGLFGMAKRAEAIGAHLSVSSGLGGTTIQLSCELPKTSFFTSFWRSRTKRSLVGPGTVN